MPKLTRCYNCDDAPYALDSIDDQGQAVLVCTGPECGAVIDVYEVQEQLDEGQELDWHKGLVVYVETEWTPITCSSCNVGHFTYGFTWGAGPNEVACEECGEVRAESDFEPDSGQRIAMRGDGILHVTTARPSELN